ncbi:MAG: hypothetical protein EA409_05875 [Saprospirales bacterium]|nr:MAG: hypothetical protein EA409_05875 [Saprospirales bacterium]
MKKNYYLPLLSLIVFFGNLTLEAQTTSLNFEILGGIGFSNVSGKSQNEFFDIVGRTDVNQIEERKSHFSPGLYAGIEMRILSTPKRYYFGPYISFSRYSSIFNSTSKREESLGWTYRNDKINNIEYRFGMGIMVQYLALQKNNHLVQPYISLGGEYRHFYKTIHDQELRFYMDRNQTNYTFTEVGKHSYIEFRDHLLWRGDIGITYTYKVKNKVPFAEIGFRYVLDTNDSDFPRERWQLFFFNLGMRMSI